MPALAENITENTVDNPQRPATAPTHAVYTPIWDWEGQKFERWLKLGVAWRGQADDPLVYMASMPIEPERSFTGYLRLVPAGEKPPAPLTMTQEEFLGDMAEAVHGLGGERP